jgi:outer membrane protein OmpA-like peptidoglycan-associated protein
MVTWLSTALLATVAGWAQETARITVGGTDMVVVREDGVLRLGPGGVVSVSGDWRAAKSRAAAGDMSAMLVELGASEAEGRMQLHLAGDVLFDFGSSAIRPDAAAELAKVATVIRQRSVGRVDVVGHTDSVGDDDVNQRLSEARALAVVRWLNAEERIPAEVIAARGMGARQPVAHNATPDGRDDPEGRARNRRVEVQFATTEAAARVTAGGSAVQVDNRGVSVGSGAVQVDGSGVSVGGGAIRVDGGGVQVGGAGAAVTVTQSQSSQPGRDRGTGGVTCAAGETCSASCEDGDCVMTCEPSADCTFSCPGGDCRMICSPGAVCSFSCDGGDCSFSCAEDSACRTSCNGGDCTCSGPGC